MKEKKNIKYITWLDIWRCGRTEKPQECSKKNEFNTIMKEEKKMEYITWLDVTHGDVSKQRNQKRPPRETKPFAITISPRFNSTRENHYLRTEHRFLKHQFSSYP